MYDHLLYSYSIGVSNNFHGTLYKYKSEGASQNKNLKINRPFKNSKIIPKNRESKFYNCFSTLSSSFRTVMTAKLRTVDEYVYLWDKIKQLNLICFHGKYQSI